jgi:NAD(P)-dependent dehydrogenase (short-subunit alcohol dehydrogenase family)
MINNNYIIITGSAGFLGSFFSKQLFNRGYNLILIDNKRYKFKKNKDHKFTNKSFLYFIDLRKENSIKSIFTKIKKKKINITGLINCAAVDTPPKKKSSSQKYLSLEDWNNEIKVGLTASYLMIKYFGEQMCKNSFGRIINLGSDLSVISPNQEIYKKSYKNYLKPASYSVIKHGLLGLTKYFASLYAQKNVTCNMISPGPVLNDQSTSLVEEIKKQTPMKRLCKQEDLIISVLFLLDENNKFMTGQNILVDGGKTII